MKQEIIEKMRAELYDSRWCKKDFEYDLKILEGDYAPFFWMVYTSGTSLFKVDAHSISALFKNSGSRFTMFRNFFSPLLCSFEFYSNSPMAKFFYWDGHSFQQVSYLDLCDVWSALAVKFYDDAVQQYPEEYECRNNKLDIQFSSVSTRNDYKAALEFAESIGDDSLKNCVERLSNYTRSSLDHYVEIGYDFAEKSFGFAIMMDGKCCMNGGIIYCDARSENRWQIHT